MEVTALRAGDRHLDAMATLAEEAVAEQTDARGGWVWSRREVRARPLRESLRAALDDPDQAVWVGLIDDTPVGYAAAAVEPLQSGDPLGRVTDLYVTAGARDVGVGEELIGKVLQWCEQRGCVGVDSLALPGNRATKNFFETFGFTARLLVLHRKLAPAADVPNTPLPDPSSESR
ncbi:N-acetyltransferase family protein [Candidatus Poriferisodalis sp.]|uniref:GNAT family N-acetyltransferase n=1 Tax=Candidatus Poriferisodalis sp. TaxID=3101277 RepID=UPI003B01F6F6